VFVCHGCVAEAVSALPCVGALVGRLLSKRSMQVCGRKGHNARTCPQRGAAIQPVQQQQPQGQKQGCSICGEPGHNARTHAQHAAAAAVTAAAAEGSTCVGTARG